MQRILILVLAAFSYAAASTNDKRCAWGESFWCSSLQYSKLCNAVDHCRTTVWSNQQLDKDSSEVCQFCQAIVADVFKYIQENKSETEIMNFLTSACDLVPDKSMSDECKLIVQSYVPEIINLIVQKVDPQVICSLLKLCTGLTDSVKHSELLPATKEPHETSMCTDCKKFAQDIKDWITNASTEDQILNQIDKYICKYMGSLESECKALVKEFLPEIMQLISSSFSVDQICQPFCMKSMQEIRIYFISLRLMKSPLYQAAMRQSSAEECVLCKTILTELQVLDRDKNVQDAIINLVKAQICDRMTTYKSECDLTVDLYASELFELLATELDPVTRCKSIGFCPASDPVRESMPKKPVKTHDSAECIMCEFVMKELKALIGDNATEAKIVAALEKVCTYLPKTIQDSCKSFIDQYGKAILDLLMQDLSPEQICTALGICNSTSVSMLTTHDIDESTKCEVCETLVQYVEALIDQNATVMEIEHVVRKICNFLPDSMKQECSAIVDEFGGLIVHYIATAFTPKEVCTLIKLCSAQTIKMQTMAPAAKAKPTSYYKCSYGPSYWCTSQANAELCQAVDHCKKYVW